MQQKKNDDDKNLDDDSAAPGESDPADEQAEDPGDEAKNPDPEGPDGGDHGDGAGTPGDVGGTDNDGGDGSSVLGSGGNDRLEFFRTVADPIDLGLADKQHVQVDYASSGAASLRLTRVYHSNSSAFPAWGFMPMGTGWRNYYDRSLQSVSGSQVRLHRANGAVLDYSYNGATWVTSLPGGILTNIPGGWQYINNRNVVEIYDSLGRLVSFAEQGRLTTLQRDGAGRLLQVTNAFGRSLNFAYDGAGRVATVTLPGGGTLGYAYDAYNNLSSIRFADNSVRQYLYENATYRNALTGVIDESGRRRLTWAYDSAGRPNYGHYGNGANAVSIVYNGDQVTTTDARGTQRVRTFGAAGPRRVLKTLQTSATADSPATNWSWNHDAAGNVASVATRTGEVRTVSADGRGRILSATRAAGTSIAFNQQHTWHPTFRVPVQSTAAGVTINRTVDGYGRVIQVTQTGTNGATSTVLQRSYNAQSLVASQTDARGATTTYTYDAGGNLSSATNALGQSTTYSNFDAHGRPGQVVRPDGTVVTRSFDTRGRMTARTVGSRTTTYSYDASNRLLQTTHPDGSWQRRNYDAAGFHSSVNNHRGETIALGRDADGRVTSRTVYTASGAVAQASFSQYDSRGRVAATIDTRGNRSTYQYAADGRPAARINPLGHNFGVQLDALDRPLTLSQPNTTAMINAGGAARVSSTLAYNAANATHQSTVDTVGVATGYATDALNRRVAEAGNDAGASAVVRNAAGDVTSTTDARGVTLAISRDSLSRVTAITPATGTALTFAYVPGRTDALLASMTDTSGSTGWTYDAQGRMLSKSQVAAGVTRTLAVTRDTLGRVSSMTYPSGMRLDVTYSGDVVSSLSVNGVALLNTISYLPFSQTAKGWTWGNGSTHSRTFDADGRVTSVSLGSVQRSYGYDSAGRLTNYVDQTSGGVVSSTMGYDEAGQLITYNGPAGTFTFNYDSNGNRRSTIRNGVTQTLSYAAGSNRLLSSPYGSYSYDAAGNPTGDGTLSFAYDSFGRLTAMFKPTDRAQRSFNGQGMRVRSVFSIWQAGGNQNSQPTSVASGPEVKPGGGNKAGSGGALVTTNAATSGAATPAATGRWVVSFDRHFLHADDGSLLGEYNATGAVQETIWFNGQPVGAMIGGVLHIIRSDHLNTPRSISRASDNVEVWRWDSEPFGGTAPTGSVNYNLRFPGQQYEGYGGYVYNWMRDYEPWTGRYLQADPLGLGGGLARYTYGKANPLQQVDPDGRWAFLFTPQFWLGVTAIVGGGIAANSQRSVPIASSSINDASDIAGPTPEQCDEAMKDQMHICDNLTTRRGRFLCRQGANNQYADCLKSCSK